MRRPVKQHVISRVLINRFAKNEHCGVFDMVMMNRRPDAKPSDIGFDKDFVPQSSGKYEEEWQRVEGMLPAVFDALDDKTLLEKPDPEEAFFVDDLMPNIAAAEKLGIHTILYHTTAALLNDLKKLHVII